MLLIYIASGSWLSQVPEAFRKGSRLVDSCSGARAILSRSVSAYHWQASCSIGLSMMRLGTHVWLCASLACPLRLRTDSTTQRSEGMPMMRLATLAHHWQAVGVFASNRRRPVNDAVGDIVVAFAHHWQAVGVFASNLEKACQ
jgi:hypothetical protein